MKLLAKTRCGDFTLELHGSGNSIYSYVVKHNNNAVKFEQGIFQHEEEAYEWYKELAGADKDLYEEVGEI